LKAGFCLQPYPTQSSLGPGGGALGAEPLSCTLLRNVPTCTEGFAFPSNGHNLLGAS